MNMEIRPSQPSDAAAVAPLIYSSGPYSFNYVFASDESTVIPFVQYAFTKNHGELQYKNHVTIVHDGEIVGCGAALSPNQPLTHTFHALGQVIRHCGITASPGVIHRALAFEKIVQPPKGDLWVIAHLGVKPECRGQGIGRQLIEYLIDSIDRRNGTRVGLDVALINPRAEALYRRLGFEVTGHRTSRLSSPFGTVPDFHRMERAI